MYIYIYHSLSISLSPLHSISHSPRSFSLSVSSYLSFSLSPFSLSLSVC